ncbi:hypothetical protein ACFL6C_12585 [Myxococcota bacterium]
MVRIPNILAALVLVASLGVIGLTFCHCDSVTNSWLFKAPFILGPPGVAIFLLWKNKAWIATAVAVGNMILFFAAKMLFH